MPYAWYEKTRTTIAPAQYWALRVMWTTIGWLSCCYNSQTSVPISIDIFKAMRYYIRQQLREMQSLHDF